MADLMASGGRGSPQVTNGISAGSTRPTAPPAQTGSPSGIRGPRAIMQERREREARQQAEREQMERIRAEEEARLIAEENRKVAERRPAVGAGGRGYAQTGGDGPPDTPPEQWKNPPRIPQQAAIPPQTRIPRQEETSRIPPATQPPQPQVRTGRTANNGAAAGGTTAAGIPQANATNEGPRPTQPRNSFPHAFERWEALSAHWEGLTSFWIRKLQQHAEDIDRDPVSAQLSRQVSDLSAAGANLFHAVVELQRLRASSERKFQRWFFETRAEVERGQEITGMLEASLQDERRSKAAAIQEALDHERGNSKTQRRLQEMQRELTISKDEARRAWEELGRREQEERDRTIALQQGQPTIVGGIQVVPMAQMMASRGLSAREAQAQAQAQQAQQALQVSTPEQVQQPQYPQYSHASPSHPTTSAPAVPGTMSSPGGARPQSQPLSPEQRAKSTGQRSEGAHSEGEYAIDAHGNFIRDAQGARIPYRGPGTPGDDTDSQADEDYDNTPTRPPVEAPMPPVSSGVSYPPSSAHHALHQYGGQQSGAPDYAGQGYAAPGWETVPRHHHPTRLSDVIEEDDERSRTTSSHVSRGP